MVPILGWVRAAAAPSVAPASSLSLAVGVVQLRRRASYPALLPTPGMTAVVDDQIGGLAPARADCDLGCAWGSAQGAGRLLRWPAGSTARSTSCDPRRPCWRCSRPASCSPPGDRAGGRRSRPLGPRTTVPRVAAAAAGGRARSAGLEVSPWPWRMTPHRSATRRKTSLAVRLQGCSPSTPYECPAAGHLPDK